MNTQASSGLGSHLTPKAHSESCLQGDWPLTRYGKHREQPCSPSGPGHRGTLEPLERWRQKDRIGGKDTHWSSVFLYLTSSSASLWHSPLSAPSRFPPVHTYAFETPSPRVASDFGGCYTSCFLACFCRLLCDLPSPKALAKLIQLPRYQWAQVFLVAWTYRASY